MAEVKQLPTYGILIFYVRFIARKPYSIQFESLDDLAEPSNSKFGVRDECGKVRFD
jgi:hypothetical protein